MRKPKTRIAALLLLAATALAVCAPLGGSLAQKQSASREIAIRESQELELFPSGKFLREISLGHPQLLADLAWLEAIQYYGKHRLSDRRYPLSPHLFKTLIEADPHFEGAYLFAALVMAEGGYLREAEQHLQKGAAVNPHSWGLRFELGFFQYVALQDYARAAQSFHDASRLEGAAEYVGRFAAASFERAGDEETARALWGVIARSSENEEIQRMAKDRLSGLVSPQES